MIPCRPDNKLKRRIYLHYLISKSKMIQLLVEGEILPDYGGLDIIGEKSSSKLGNPTDDEAVQLSNSLPPSWKALARRIPESSD